jgi:hypothetical protein
MPFRKPFASTLPTNAHAGLRLVPQHAIEARLMKLFDTYRKAYDAEDLEDYLEILKTLEPYNAEEFRQVCRTWLGNPENKRAPYPGELKALLEAQQRQAHSDQAQELESWQRPPPERVPKEVRRKILAGLKPELRWW